MSKDTEAIITAIKMLHEEHKMLAKSFVKEEAKEIVGKSFDDFWNETERIIESIYED